MDTLRLVFEIVSIAGTSWFWPHCARPSLVWLRAGPVVYRLVLGVTVLTVATFVGQVLAELARVSFDWGSPRWWIALIVGGLWIVVVGLGWPRYSLLLRLAGGR
jgi:hypothetical protein